MEEQVFGHYRHAIGANRVRIPSEYRKFVGDDSYVVPGPDGSILLIPKENLKLVLGRYNDNDAYFSELKEFSRRINRKMFKAAIDTQFRMTVGPEFRKLAKGMESAIEIEFCGRGDFIEIWPAHVFDKKFSDEEEDDFDEMIAALKARLNK